jgi:hypothetical protein
LPTAKLSFYAPLTGENGYEIRHNPREKIELALICTENRHSSSIIAPKRILLRKLNAGAHPGKIMKKAALFPKAIPAGAKHPGISFILPEKAICFYKQARMVTAGSPRLSFSAETASLRRQYEAQNT